ncbi:MAG: hypothetical protein LBK44_00530, partial [Spirochaetales bacterium]|nr:hypothetical protein [Spirochaetales bacterium]
MNRYFYFTEEKNALINPEPVFPDIQPPRRVQGPLMIRLLVFLGNPGREYEKTRHNAAWLVAENLPLYATLAWQEKWKGRYAVFPGGHTAENPLGRATLLLPQTYMN